MPLHKLKVSRHCGVCQNGSTKKQRRHSIKICIRFHYQSIQTHFNIFTQWFCFRFHHSGIFLLIANFCSLFFSFGVFWLPESYKEPWWILWGGSLKRHQSTSICTKFSIINGLSEKKLAAWTSRGTYRHNNISCQISQSFVFVIHHRLLKIPTLAWGPQVVASGPLSLVVDVCDVFLWLFFFGSREENALVLGRQLESHVSMT